ncbi:MAG: rod shape-determining protein MreC [Candidatus Velthaea sp.]
MVSIFTYRDERKLLAVIGVVIVAAILALLQLDFARAGRTSPLTATVTTVATYAQLAVTTVSNAIRGGWSAAVNTPQLASTNARLVQENAALQTANDALAEALSRVPAERDLALAQARYPEGIAATVIGYDPEATQRIVTIDKGAREHVRVDEGVVTARGVVGRIIEVAPISAKVLLVTDIASRLPAVVQRGRWWAIAAGTQTRIKLQYVSQDAKLRVGDRVVTGEGRSFHAGYPIGTISEVYPQPAGALDQTAVVAPAVEFGSLSRVLVLPQ